MLFSKLQRKPNYFLSLPKKGENKWSWKLFFCSTVLTKLIKMKHFTTWKKGTRQSLLKERFSHKRHIIRKWKLTNHFVFNCRVRHLPVEDFIDCLLPPQIEKEITGSRLQLVLLSPTMLQVLARNSNTPVGRFLHPDRVIAIMLGVRDAQILPEHRNSLISFSQWIHLEAKDHDLEFVQTVLYFSTQILQRSHKIKAMTSSNASASIKLARSASNNCRPSESTLFHVHPRRVTEVNHLTNRRFTEQMAVIKIGGFFALIWTSFSNRTKVESWLYLKRRKVQELPLKLP